MAGKNCKIVMDSSGKQSRLYKGLLQKFKGNRAVANMLYAAYFQIQDTLDNKNKLRVYNGAEHSLEDVCEALNVNEIRMNLYMLQDKYADIDVDENGQRLSYDDHGKAIEYDDGNLAYEKADKFNDAHPGIVAQVLPKGDKFIITLSKRDMFNQSVVGSIKENRHLWDIMANEFESKNIPLDRFKNIVPELMSPIGMSQFLYWSDYIKTIPDESLSLRDLELLLALEYNKNGVANFVNRHGGGDFHAAAVDAYNAIHNIANSMGISPTITHQSVTRNMLREARHLDNAVDVDITALRTRIADESTNFRDASDIFKTQKKIDELCRDFRRGYNVIEHEAGVINNLQDAAYEAAATYERELRIMLKKKGITQESKDLEQKLIQLAEGIEKHQHIAGLTTFLNEGIAYSKTITQRVINLTRMSGTGSVLERARKQSELYMSAKHMLQGYLNIASSIAAGDELFLAEGMTDAEKQALQDAAKNLCEGLNKQSIAIGKLLERIGRDVAMEILMKDKECDPLDVANYLKMASSDDSTWYDYLYSIGRVSDPLVAATGTVIRDMQKRRDQKLALISEKIRGAENKLKKAQGRKVGADTRFMFTANGRYIVSVIDWDAYYKARSAAKKRASERGLKGLALEEAVENWEKRNTISYEVDHANVRFERIPNDDYRLKDDPFAGWTQEMHDYYREMMELKGQMGTLLPEYAQHQFEAPQIRRDLLDMVAAWKRKEITGRELLDNLLDRMKWWKIREDDTDYASNGNIVNGEEYMEVASDFDNTPAESIPIFYRNRIKDNTKLSKKIAKERMKDPDIPRYEERGINILRDFSTAMQRAASTALNYEAMNQIEDTVNTMADFIEMQGKPAKSSSDVKESHTVNLIKSVMSIALKKKGDSKSLAILQGFIDSQIYGKKMVVDTETTKFWKGLLRYNSIKSLAVNIKGATANYFVGELQMLIASGGGMGGKYYNMKDLAVAHAILLGDNTLRIKPRLMDFLSNNKNSLSVLMEERFDPTQDLFSDASHTRYHNNAFRQLFGGFNAFGGYAAGEYLIHYVTMYAILNHHKVFYTDTSGHTSAKKSKYKHYTLLDALDRRDNGDGTYSLCVKPGFTIAENGKDTGIAVPSNLQDDFWNKIADDIQFSNQQTHGSMNEEDKGIIHRYILGRAVMNLRQWMVEHYSRRFRTRHWDSAAKEFVTGYQTRAAQLIFTDEKYQQAKLNKEDEFNTKRMMWEMAKSFSRFFWRMLSCNMAMNAARKAVGIDAKHITDGYSEKDAWAMSQTIAEYELFGLICMCCGLAGDPDRYKKQFLERFLLYQLKRAKMELGASTFPYLLPEVTKLINSPVSSVSTLNGMLYPIVGLLEGDEFKTVQRGKYAGWNKYLSRLFKYTIPFGSQIQSFLNMDEDDAPFEQFDVVLSMLNR